MSYLKTTQAAATAALVFYLAPSVAAPMTLEEFNKMPSDEQGSYVSAAVAMAAYIAAADGDLERARCVRRWFFGTNGEPGKGPEAIANEISFAERANLGRYHIEGIVLGALEKACSVGPRQEDTSRKRAP